MTVGESVRRARQARKMTVTALARASRLSKGFISQVESGRSNPSLESLGRIAASLGLPVNVLLRDPASAAPPPTAAQVDFRVFRAGQGDPSTSDIRHVTDQGDRHFCLVRLGQGKALVPPGIGPDGGEGFVVIVQGAVSLLQSPTYAKLGPGDSASWDMGRRYVLENRDPLPALLFLSTSSALALPAVADFAPARSRQDAEPRGTPYPSEGPLRLAALRAGRDRRGDR